MAQNFLLRARCNGRLVAERWITWAEALRGKHSLESTGMQVTIDWLDPDCFLRPVESFDAPPHA